MAVSDQEMEGGRLLIEASALDIHVHLLCEYGKTRPSEARL